MPSPAPGLPHETRTKPYLLSRENAVKQIRIIKPSIEQGGFDHVGNHPQRNIPPLRNGRPAVHRKPRGKAMTEAIAGLCVLLSASIFLAHAFDAYRMR
jgi:hypothetical protein